jgi:hypothetical protein
VRIEMLGLAKTVTLRLRNILTNNRIWRPIFEPTYRAWVIRNIVLLGLWLGLLALALYFAKQMHPAVVIFLCVLIWCLTPDLSMWPSRSNYERENRPMETAISDVVSNSSGITQSIPRGDSTDDGAPPPPTNR